MTNKQRIVTYSAFAAVGTAVTVAGMLGYADGAIAGCGGVLLAISALKLFKGYRYETDPAYAKRIDTSNADERLAFLATKAAESTFQLSVILLAVLSLVLRPLGANDTANLLGCIMAGQVALYWLSYLFVSKKY
jgi:heme O synthase-like polyprenyltransferase